MIQMGALLRGQQFKGGRVVGLETPRGPGSIWPLHGEQGPAAETPNPVVSLQLGHSRSWRGEVPLVTAQDSSPGLGDRSGDLRGGEDTLLCQAEAQNHDTRIVTCVISHRLGACGEIQVVILRQALTWAKQGGRKTGY